MATNTVTRGDFDKLTDTLDRWRVRQEVRIDKHEKTLYGNGEPGMDEQIRGIHAWISEQKKASDKRAEFWGKFSWLVITLAVSGVTAFIGQALYFWFRVVPELSKLTGN